MEGAVKGDNYNNTPAKDMKAYLRAKDLPVYGSKAQMAATIKLYLKAMEQQILIKEQEQSLK